MAGESETFRLAEAVGASLGGLAAFFVGRDERARDTAGGPKDFVLVIAPNSLEIRFHTLPNSLPTVQQLGQVLAPLCRLDRTDAARVHVLRHGDAALDTRLPVEAVLCLNATARKDQVQSTMRVSSIAAVAAHDLRPGGAVVRFSALTEAATGGLPDALVEHIHVFAAIHGAARCTPLCFNYDVLGRQGTSETDRGRARGGCCPIEGARVDHFDSLDSVRFASGCMAASGTSGFSIRVGGQTFAAAAALWVNARDAPAAEDGATSMDDAYETRLVCFDACGLLPDPIARRAISRAAWKQRGGLACRTRRGDGALVIQNDDMQVARVVVYLYPDGFGGSLRVVNAKDGPEALVRSAINTAVSSLQGVVVRTVGRSGGRDGSVGEPAVDEAIVQMAACLKRVRARASGEYAPEHSAGYFEKTLRGILLAPGQHM